MIIDLLENGPCYTPLHPGFAKAFDFLKSADLLVLEDGSYDIDGERVFAVIARESGRTKEDGLLEIHERYIDIQLVLAGTETMGWRPKSTCIKEATAYDREKDLQFFYDKPWSWATVREGSFAVFFPEDAHLPLVSPGPIHKVIIKVARG